MEKNKKEFIEAEVVEVMEPAAVQEEAVETEKEMVFTGEDDIVCELRVGLRKDGGIFFNIHGEDQSLITISGLLRYAEEEQKQIWSNRLQQR